MSKVHVHLNHLDLMIANNSKQAIKIMKFLLCRILCSVLSIAVFGPDTFLSILFPNIFCLCVTYIQVIVGDAMPAGYCHHETFLMFFLSPMRIPEP